MIDIILSAGLSQTEGNRKPSYPKKKNPTTSYCNLKKKKNLFNDLQLKQFLLISLEMFI